MDRGSERVVFMMVLNIKMNNELFSESFVSWQVETKIFWYMTLQWCLTISINNETVLINYFPPFCFTWLQIPINNIKNIYKKKNIRLWYVYTILFIEKNIEKKIFIYSINSEAFEKVIFDLWIPFTIRRHNRLM
jgi:hypothetical protein